jgi:hypothetical protein
MLVVVDLAITFEGVAGLVGGKEIAYLAIFENSLGPIAF